MNYKELKKAYSDKMGEIMTSNKVFFAFSVDQFNEAIKENGYTKEDKFVHLGAGGYIAKENLDNFLKDNQEAKSWYQKQYKAIKNEKAELEKAILQELLNYECFYSGDLTEVLAIFSDEKDTVKQVYKKHIDVYVD